MFPTGELTKLRILSYSDAEFNSPVSDGEFTTLINPEKYSFHYKIEQNEEQGTGTSSNSIKFNKTLPETLDLSFVFDRTGAIKTSKVSENGVIDDVEKFKKVVFAYDGENHQPSYLKILWGTLVFKGKLSEMEIEFKLFNASGIPIRAVALAKFTGFVDEELRVAQEDARSPDLTHLRTVYDGDTLPLMCYRIYGDSKYYLDVAKANNIYDFRNLVTGKQLFFPPLNKTS